jgi:two-component system, cell cycle sensor histidine kinase and response regulator CckA
MDSLLRAVAEMGATAVVIVDESGKIVLANRQAESLFQYDPGEMIGQPMTMLVPEPWTEPAAPPVRTTGRRKDRQEIPLEIDLRAAGTGPGRMTVISFVHTATRQEAAKHVQDNEERYRILFDTNPNPMWVYDLATLAFLAVNEAAIYQYGYSREEFLGMTIRDIRPAVEIPLLVSAVSRPNLDPLLPVVWHHQKKDGTLIDVEITAAGLLFDGRPAELILAHDVTRRTRLEEQFRQAQKMEAVGRLAGGIAHDFNNILSAIMSYAELLRPQIAEGGAQNDLDEIANSAERAALLTRQILAFSRQQILAPAVLDLNEVVAGLDRMLRRIIGEDIQLETRLAPSLGRIKADRGQLNQVIMNLVVNARDAMQAGGRLLIETSDLAVDADYAGQAGVEQGDYVLLTVTDTGSGMTREQLAHIFEPFFTTKDQGKGTGLGLSTAYGIVKQSGGYIWVYSEPNRGTTFKIYLPRVNEPLQPLTTTSSVRRSRGNETILLVEDDDAVRRAARRILEREGYAVLESADVDAACRSCRDFPGTIDLLLSDVVMPGMNGFELSTLLLGMRPAMRVLLMSGYSENTVQHRGDLLQGIGYLEKPFTTTLLARKVRDVLDDTFLDPS